MSFAYLKTTYLIWLTILVAVTELITIPRLHKIYYKNRMNMTT
jgi:hypothetical protein